MPDYIYTISNGISDTTKRYIILAFDMQVLYVGLDEIPVIGRGWHSMYTDLTVGHAIVNICTLV